MQPRAGLSHALAHQYHVGQPVLVGTAQHGYVAGVTAHRWRSWIDGIFESLVRLIVVLAKGC